MENVFGFILYNDYSSTNYASIEWGFNDAGVFTQGLKFYLIPKEDLKHPLTKTYLMNTWLMKAIPTGIQRLTL